MFINQSINQWFIDSNIHTMIYYIMIQLDWCMKENNILKLLKTFNFDGVHFQISHSMLCIYVFASETVELNFPFSLNRMSIVLNGSSNCCTKLCMLFSSGL